MIALQADWEIKIIIKPNFFKMISLFYQTAISNNSTKQKTDSKVCCTSLLTIAMIFPSLCIVVLPDEFRIQILEEVYNFRSFFQAALQIE